MKRIEFDDAAHRETFNLLPWWVNDSLDAAERRQVDQHLSVCSDCRREVEQLRRMRSIIKSDELDVTSTHALNRLRKRIDEQGIRSPWLDGIRSTWRGTSRWLRRMLIVQGAMIMSLLLLFVIKPTDQAAVYRTLSAAPAPATPHAYITVVFDGSVTEREMRILLLSLHANLVTGPTPEGVYVLALEPAQQPAALKLLRAQPRHAVLFAEPTLPPLPSTWPASRAASGGQR